MIKTLIYKIKNWWYRKKGYYEPLIINSSITVNPNVYGPLNDIKRKYIKNMINFLCEQINNIKDVREFKSQAYIKNICTMLNANVISISKLEMDYYKDSDNYVKITYREPPIGPNKGKGKGNLLKYMVFVPNRNNSNN